MILHTLKPTSKALNNYFCGNKNGRKEKEMKNSLFTLIMQCHEVCNLSFHNTFLIDI